MKTLRRAQNSARLFSIPTNLFKTSTVADIIKIHEENCGSLGELFCPYLCIHKCQISENIVGKQNLFNLTYVFPL